MLPMSVQSCKGQQPRDTPTAHFRRFMRVARTLERLPKLGGGWRSYKLRH